jgi:hypothetical protein
MFQTIRIKKIAQGLAGTTGVIPSEPMRKSPTGCWAFLLPFENKLSSRQDIHHYLYFCCDMWTVITTDLFHEWLEQQDEVTQ